MMSADWGRDQVILAAEAGADIVLLIGAASTASVSAAVEASRRLGIPIVLDVHHGRLDQAWVHVLERIGVDGFAITTNIDLGVAGPHPLEQARVQRSWSQLPVVVSGGFDIADDIVNTERSWDILVVGRSVTRRGGPSHRRQASGQPYQGPTVEVSDMIITPLGQCHIPAVERLISLGTPYVRLRTSSDYWLYAKLFSSTCPIAIQNDQIVGMVVAFRSQDNPGDVYIQDVMTHPEYRRRGIARALVETVRQQAATWRCERLYLTSESDNTASHATWLSIGFTNIPGDCTENGVSVISNYKGPGKHRAVYELNLKQGLQE